MAESRKRQQTIDREELRLVFAAIFMHAEISGARGVIDDNGELAERGLRRADMLMHRHERSTPKAGQRGAERQIDFCEPK